jgi:hypothetical protein
MSLVILVSSDRGLCRVIDVASVTALVAACLSISSCTPTSPTPVDRALSVHVVPKNPVRLLPDMLEAKVESFRPYRWTAGWTVRIERTEGSPARPVTVQSVRARIEAHGRVLAETVTALGSQPLSLEGVSVDQSLSYESASAPPSQSRLAVTVRVSDAAGVSTDVSTAGNTIEERYCGGRAQPECSGPYVAILGNGTLLTDSGVPEYEVWVGQTAYFFNGHRTLHAFRSDPHPGHTDCDALNQVDLGVGQYAHSDTFNKVGTCGFHDEANPDNPALRGRIIVRCCIF